MILRYRPGRVISAGLLTVVAAAACAAWAMHVPEPEHSGRYALLHSALGQVGIATLLWGVAAILAYSAFKLLLPLASGLVAAESDDAGIRINSAGYMIALEWSEVHRLEHKDVGAKNKIPIVIVHHAPKRAGLFGSRRTSAIIPSLLSVDQWQIDAWLAQVEARMGGAGVDQATTQSVRS